MNSTELKSFIFNFDKTRIHIYLFGLQHAGYNKDTKEVDFAEYLELTNEELQNISEDELLSVVPVIKNKYRYKYQGQERQDELDLNWDSFKWRNYDYAIGRFMSVDPLAEKYARMTPYQFSSNQVMHAPEIEGLENLQDLVERFSPIAIVPTATYSGTEKSIGVNISVGIPKALSPVAVRHEFGASYVAEDATTGKSGWETRRGIERSIGFGLASQTTTSYSNGYTDQTLREIKMGFPFLNIATSNDITEFGGDGGDRWRTAAVEINVGAFSLGTQVGTGDPGISDRPVNANLGPNGTYISKNGSSPDKYRLGNIYLRVGSFGVQMNSESNRAFIQNTLVHDVLGYPRFREVATPRTPLNNPFGLSLDFSIGGNTLWD